MTPHKILDKTMVTQHSIIVGDYTKPNGVSAGIDSFLNENRNIIYGYFDDILAEHKTIFCEGMTVPTINMLKTLNDKHLLILLDIDADTAIGRIKKRGRHNKEPDRKYIEKIINEKRNIIEKARALKLADVRKIRVSNLSEAEVEEEFMAIMRGSNIV